jgi:hypothetical protein
MPPRPKYQVFISSTYGDLRAEREAVTWAILSARHIPAGMENFTATDDRGWQTILSVINRSDYYVLILAGKYGSLDADGKSWTEKEYEYAVSRKIPVLAFVRSKQTTTADRMEDDPALKGKLEDFKRRVRDKHLCKEWTTAEDLATQVRDALTNHILDDEEMGRARPGWYRGDEMPSASTLDEFARLSEENARLTRELAEVKSSADTAPRLALVDRDEQPLPDKVSLVRKLNVYTSGLWNINAMSRERTKHDDLILNTLVGLELGVQNVSGSLVEHVAVDLTLTPLLGFKCGVSGIHLRLANAGGRWSNSTVPPEHRHEYPDFVNLLGPGRVSIRLRIPRVPAGGTEYLPPLFVVGAVNGAWSLFDMRYKLAGSVGAPVVGNFRHEIAFEDSTNIELHEGLEQAVRLKALMDTSLLREIFIEQ